MKCVKLDLGIHPLRVAYNRGFYYTSNLELAWEMLGVRGGRVERYVEGEQQWTVIDGEGT